MKVNELDARIKKINKENNDVILFLNENGINGRLFIDPFECMTTISCYENNDNINGLNHLLTYIGEKESSKYLLINENYVEINNFSELNKLIGNDFVDFDILVENKYKKTSNLLKYNDISKK